MTCDHSIYIEKKLSGFIHYSDKSATPYIPAIHAFSSCFDQFPETGNYVCGLTFDHAVEVEAMQDFTSVTLLCLNLIYSQDHSVVAEPGVGPQENEGVGEIRLKGSQL